MKFSIKVGDRVVCETDDRGRAEAFYERYTASTRDEKHHNAGAVVEFIEDGKVVESSAENIDNPKDDKVKFNKKTGTITPDDTDGDGQDDDTDESCKGMTKMQKKWAAIAKNKKNEAASDGKTPAQRAAELRRRRSNVVQRVLSKDQKASARMKKSGQAAGQRQRAADYMKHLSKRRTSEANNGSRSWGMALNDNPNALPPTRPGNPGMWMLSIMEGKRSDGQQFVNEKNAELSQRIVEALVEVDEVKKETAASLRKKDKSRQKRLRRGRGLHSTAAIRKAAKQNLRKSKAKRKSAKARLKAERSRKRNKRLRGE